MLRELTVTDFAIIDHLQLSFCPHLNVFTGETGAGKSIIVDAISALVGERVGAESVEPSTDPSNLIRVMPAQGTHPNSQEPLSTARAVW